MIDDNEVLAAARRLSAAMEHERQCYDKHAELVRQRESAESRYLNATNARVHAEEALFALLRDGMDLMHFTLSVDLPDGTQRTVTTKPIIVPPARPATPPGTIGKA